MLNQFSFRNCMSHFKNSLSLLGFEASLVHIAYWGKLFFTTEARGEIEVVASNPTGDKDFWKAFNVPIKDKLNWSLVFYKLFNVKIM